MHAFCRTQVKKTALTVVPIVVLCVLILVAGIFLLNRPVDILDSNAIAGEPAALPQEFGYSEFMQPGFGLIRLCANPDVDGKDIYLYITNPIINPHLLRVEVYTAEKRVIGSTGEVKWEPDKLLGKSGFIEPGSYLECVSLSKRLPEGESPIIVKAALRNAETGGSEGFVYLNMMINNEK